MYRFYCLIKNISGDKIIIEDKGQIHHAKDVLRLKINDVVCTFDERGNEYICRIKELLNTHAVLMIKDKRLSKTQKMKITVACAIPKKSKMDDIIDKLTQLGVDRIIPLETERVIVNLDKHKKISRQKRWQKIALCASQQSQRDMLPIVEPIRDIKDLLLHSGDYDLKIMPTLTAARKSLKEVFVKSKPKDILVLIGPEGDFTPSEVDLAKKVGCIPVSLGDLVLRVETAAVAVASFVRLYADR